MLKNLFDSLTTKSFTISLRADTHAHLRKLSKHFGISQNYLIDRLIERAGVRDPDLAKFATKVKAEKKTQRARNASLAALEAMPAADRREFLKSLEKNA